jgi:Fe-S-cluster-containing hydrogenase component 2
MFPPQFSVVIDNEKCEVCRRCTINCSFGALSYDETEDRIVANDKKCVSCLRCASKCPQSAITIKRNETSFSPHPTWTPEIILDIITQAETGGVLISGCGNDIYYPCFFDRIVIDACQVTNPSIDPLREPIEVYTYLGNN